MGRGKFKGKPTGRRQFSTPEEMLAGTSSRPRTFKKMMVGETLANYAWSFLDCSIIYNSRPLEGGTTAKRIKKESQLSTAIEDEQHSGTAEEAEVEEVERSDEESEESSEEDSDRKKGTQGIIEIENPNMARPKTLKARDVDLEKTTELSRREREEIEKQRAHERYMKLQEQGKTEQARKDLERLALIRQQRAEAAKKREEEKAAKDQKKAEARK
ncbi:Casein kinase substrate, phosphoprotein PP28 [Cynara cardunculus var. scolymus]|uniref:Casein kinase substrate, phosphoprotein PP28 n=1 Tax=Cynara cardunculus var. scolymus TaxID=59895 RepID=A0A103XU71_CYNCS|nr:Casein kinase substrate, phosphoprotein PP28 [Cynara cardunculus var. scolymus]